MLCSAASIAADTSRGPQFMAAYLRIGPILYENACVQVIDLEADEVLFTDDAGASFTGSR